VTFEGTDQLLKRTQAFVSDHRAIYLASGGAEGHIVDLTHAGARGLLPTLLLKTRGRRSGKSLIVPLIYGIYADAWVVVGSKGGAPKHPDWFLNLEATPDVSFQIATQAFLGTWSLPAENERKQVWTYMEQLFPPYVTYRESAGARTIPLVMLRPTQKIAVFRTDD
jgi:deazaflavin-dependent oxidoreductase (nitroreductase family)